MADRKHQSGSLNSQDTIWHYFQNCSPEVFTAAKPRLDALIKQMSRQAPVGIPSVLNIGAGDGYLEEAVHQRGWQVHSLDPDEKTVQQLIGKKIKAHRGYIEQMPFADAQFDFVVASEVLEHLTDEQRQRGIQEVARVLKKGGWFIGTVPYGEDLLANQVICPQCGEVFHRWGHKKSFDLESLRDELSPSLEVAKVKTTAFVTFRERSLFGKLKGLIRLLMAKSGAAVAIPSIYFLARKQ